jgi:gliding motility-associated-like protein
MKTLFLILALQFVEIPLPNGHWGFSGDCEFLVPNAFTPNHDGVNDEFFVKVPTDCAIKDFRLEVYDAYGRLIFKTKEIKDKWNGTYDGFPLPAGTYFWKLTGSFEGGGNTQKSGTVLIIL